MKLRSLHSTFVLRPSFFGAFTLVELLVSMAVLALLLVMVAQLVNSTAIITGSGNKRVDADGQARLVFDRMANDFSKIVKRSDVDCIFAKQNGNDAMFFYSEAPAYASTSLGSSTTNSVALVGYRINTNNANYQPPTYASGYPVLERLGETLSWDGTASNDATASTDNSAPGGVLFFTYPAGNATPLPATTLAGNWSKTIGTAANNYTDGKDQDYHVLSDSVYRMEIAFLLTDGTTSTIPVTNPTTSTNSLTATLPPTSSIQSYTVGSRWYDNSASRGYICTSITAVNPTTGAPMAVWAPIGIQDISAIIVAIAILDDTSRKIVTNYSNIVGALLDPTSGDLSSVPPNLMGQTWGNAVNSLDASGNPISPGFAARCGIPLAAASQVRIYQRAFYIKSTP